MRHSTCYFGRALWLTTIIFGFASLPATCRADALPMTHPTVELVTKYFKLVVEQDWKTAATMIRPSSIERKKRETLAIIKSAPTMSEEAAMLGKLGAKDIKELENMSVQDFYVADRQSFHNPTKNNEEVQKQKRESLKITVIGVVGEEDGKVAHLAVRTSQEVLDQRINELFFISFVQDEKDPKVWLIAPDMQRPATETLGEPKEDKKAEPEAKK